MVKWPTRRRTTNTITTTTPTLNTATTTTIIRRKTMSTRSFLAIVIVIASLVRAINGFLPIQQSATGRALSSQDSRKLFGGYRITPKQCRATKTLPISDPRVNGPTICMFNHECAQRNGEVVGACMDGFLFGACCQIPNIQDVASTLINDAQNAYFQQYQHKQQMQQAMSNPLAAQSYENYGENSMQQQSMEVTSSTTNNYQQKQPQTSSYQTTPHVSSTSSGTQFRPEYHQTSSTTSSVSSTIYKRPQETTTTNIVNSDSYSQEGDKSDASTSSAQSEQELDNSSSPSVETEPGSSTKSVSSRPATATPTTLPMSQPPRLHVHKDSVKISSPSSPPHNDDFVMQVLSTLAPDHDTDHITFTTEVPMKIASNNADQLSSESNSFEEEPSATQIPVHLVNKPTRQDTNPPQTTTHKTQQQQQPQQQQQQKHHLNPFPNMHHHNHLLLDVNEFTHSDITHQGADADIVEEDLQFSTGYGPQPAVIVPPNQNAPVTDYNTESSSKTPQPDDKYVLVQTISNDQPYKNPSGAVKPTTSSAITTHVDSIESIILQLNNSNPGPVYSVASENEEPDSYSTTLSGYQGASDKNAGPVAQQDNYYGSNTSPASVTVKPLAAAPTEPPTSYYEEMETKRPADYQEQKYPDMTAQVPAYLEPVTTNLNFVPENEYAADAMTAAMESSSFGPSSYKPAETVPTSTYSDESGAVLNDHTMPDKNYNDAAASGHQTSEFNKMPAVGIAYPVDMSYLEEDGSIAAEDDAGYQKLSTQATSQKPAQPSSTATNTYGAQTEQSTSQAATTYTKLSIGTGSKPSQSPMVSYIGVVTAPMYSQQPQASVYNQVPDEVSIVSHTTKVQEEYDSPAPSYQSTQNQKLTTINYVESEVTTIKPPKAKPVTLSYGSSTLPTAAPRPPYESLVLGSSTYRPKPTKRPTTTKKTTKPHGTKKPTTSYVQVSQSDYPQSGYQDKVTTTSANKPPTNSYNTQPSKATKKPTPPSSYGQSPSSDYSNNKKPTNSYNNQPVKVTKQPSSSYQSPVTNANTQASSYNQEITETNVYHTTTEKLALNPYDSLLSSSKKPEAAPQPSNAYNQHPVEKVPAATYNQVNTASSQPAVSYNQAQYISSPPAKTQKPLNQKKPISTSYVTGPTSPRPLATFAYDNEVPPLLVADDKLDSFVDSTPGSVPSPAAPTYHAPVYVTGITPLQVQQPHNVYNTHKKPGFVQIKSTTRPPTPTVVITPKPTTNGYVKQPNSDSYDTASYQSTTPMPHFASTSYIFSPTITKRPDFMQTAPEYVSLPSITSNDFDDPGYYGAQNTPTQATYAVPSDDRPAFPGYYGPTPTYPAFQIPGEKNDGSIEETYTSPNDFVNFPPVRNPNLNMSAASSAVTSDLELSTPAFVEDGVLKDKMNTLVHKIVESLQGNFEALADIIDETGEPSTYSAGGAYPTTTATRKPTKKPVPTRAATTLRPRTTTKKTVPRTTTRPPTRKPTVTTRKPTTRRTTTRKPITTRKPTKKPTPTTTNAAPFQDELIDEEDEEDVNPVDNEIDDAGSGFVGVGANGRKLQCGVRPHVKSGRIVGGKGSAFGAYPWQVLVRESTWLGLFTKNKCGGVLITNKYVITAAHCQPGFLASLVAVMGEFDISGDLETKKAVTKNVKRVIVHREYDAATFENDLALLELESPVQYDTHIVPICMPSDSADFTGRMATVTGWGRLKYGGGVPSVLQEVQVPIIENSVCQEMFHTAGHNKKILNSFLCAGYANGQKDSCEGDSGGPLVLQRPDGRYELAGTVSHGIKCAAPYLPGVYMRTTFYKPWLRSITGVK